MGNWHQNVQNIIRNLIGNLIRMFWCQCREFLSQSQKGNSLNSFSILSKVLMWLKQVHAVSVDFQAGFGYQPSWMPFALQCNIVILRSLHRYSEYWRPRSRPDCRYFDTIAWKGVARTTAYIKDKELCSNKKSILAWR